MPSTKENATKKCRQIRVKSENFQSQMEEKERNWTTKLVKLKAHITQYPSIQDECDIQDTTIQLSYVSQCQGLST